MKKIIKWLLVFLGIGFLVLIIFLASLILNVGGKKVTFKSEGKFTYGDTTTPAVIYGEISLFAPYIAWADELGTISAELWIGDDGRGFQIYKVSPSVSSVMVYLKPIVGDEKKGAYCQHSNRILITDFLGGRFEGECEPFTPLISITSGL
jgi:hypothetical protein